MEAISSAAATDTRSCVCLAAVVTPGERGPTLVPVASGGWGGAAAGSKGFEPWVLAEDSPEDFNSGMRTGLRLGQRLVLGLRSAISAPERGWGPNCEDLLDSICVLRVILIISILRQRLVVIANYHNNTFVLGRIPSLHILLRCQQHIDILIVLALI